MPVDATVEETSPAFVSRYNALIGGLQLANVRLASAEISAPTIYVHDSSRKLAADIETESTYFVIDSGFVVKAVLRFVGRYPDEESAKVTVSIGLELVYVTSETMDDDIFGEFERRNLPLNAWPFFREFLQNALARTTWPVYTLPAFKHD